MGCTLTVRLTRRLSDPALDRARLRRQPKRRRHVDCPTLGMMERGSVLVVEDDPAIGVGLVSVLRDEGYGVRLEADRGRALAAVEDSAPQLVILDLGLPDVDGLSVCRQLRGRFPRRRSSWSRQGPRKPTSSSDSIPVPTITSPSRFASPNCSRGYAPSCAARWTRPGPTSLTVGDLEIDRDGRECSSRGVELELRRKEFDLLNLLVGNAGTVVTRERIMAEVWDTDSVRRDKDARHARLERAQEDRGFDGPDHHAASRRLPRRRVT